VIIVARLDEADLMRFKGTITEWNDDRGFGFIAPSEGGARVFCHIKAFTERSSRPEIGKTVTYELAKDDRGRMRATQVRYAGTAKPPPAASPPSRSSLAQAVVGASVFLVGIAALVVMGRAPWWVLPWYLVLSVVTFMLYGWDKVSARGGHWRTQESTLNGLALMGGWPGGWVAQHAWRHKSRKTSFQAAFWSATLVNVGVFLFFVIFGVEALI
jgi:uncharacterized membrane protein YsdA (DUF1294 family)/cold shock CspA family protein